MLLSNFERERGFVSKTIRFRNKILIIVRDVSNGCCLILWLIYIKMYLSLSARSENDREIKVKVKQTHIFLTFEKVKH